jgi:hypothetical protein
MIPKILQKMMCARFRRRCAPQTFGPVSGEGKLTAELPKEIIDMFKNLAKGGGGDAELANARTMLQDKGYSTQGHLVDLVI